MQLAETTGRKNDAKKSPSGHHRTTLSGYIFAIKALTDNRKKLLNSNTSFTCPGNMANFGPLAAEIVSLVWGTPANFNGFRILAALLHALGELEGKRGGTRHKGVLGYDRLLIAVKSIIIKPIFS